MKTTFQKWLIILVLAVGLYVAADLYKGENQRQRTATINGWKAKLSKAQEEANDLAAKWPEDRLVEARAKAERTRGMVKPVAAWTEAKAKLQSAKIMVTETQKRSSDREGAPTRVTVTLSFANMSAEDAVVDAIASSIRMMDSEFSGCQRVNLALLPPLNNGGLPRGVFADGSEAVYEFHVILN